MAEFSQKERYDIADLIGIVRLLRAPDGCPWDREQDHRSIRKNLIEETYEVAEAIDMRSVPMLREELGDLLLQIVMHAQMEAEAGNFTFSDVCNEICQKLIIRHPHVFGDVQVGSSGEVLKNWEAIKQQTKGQVTAAQTLESVPKTLPALMRAGKVQHRAAKVGFGYPDVAAAFCDLESEVRELSAELQAENRQAAAQEAGDVLFAAVNVVRQLGQDPEELLGETTDRFVRRVGESERIAAEKGRALQDCSPLELDACWREAKDKLREQAHRQVD